MIIKQEAKWRAKVRRSQRLLFSVVTTVVMLFAEGVLSQTGKTKDHPTLHGTVPLFHKFNPLLGHFELLEKKAIDPHFLVILVRATLTLDTVLREKAVGSDFKDEAFGVFLVNSKTQQIHLSLDIFPTERMHDFQVAFEKVSHRLVVVSGKGATYGDGAGKKEYFFDISKRELIRKIDHSGLHVGGMARFQGALYFLASDTSKEEWEACWKEPERCYTTKSLIVRLESPERYRDPYAYEIIESIGNQSIPEMHCIQAEAATLLLEGPQHNLNFSVRPWKMEKRVQQPELLNSCLAKRNTFTLTGEPERKFFVCNHGFCNVSSGSDQPSGIHEDSYGKPQFHPIPQPSYELFARYRPESVKHGYTRNATTIQQEVGPAQLFERKIWFGTSFYNGEGTTGLGGIGWFDIDSRKYQISYYGETADWSTSAIYVDRDSIWLGLMRRPEGASYGGGVLWFNRKQKTFKRYSLSAIVTSIERHDGLVFLTTANGLSILDNDSLQQVTFDVQADGRYAVSRE